MTPGSIHNRQSAFSDALLFPVILSVPAQVGNYSPRDRVKYLSRHARKALQISAEKSGARIGELVKDDKGVPQPFDGIYWSISHKTDYVCGVVAPTPIGIDIERIRSFSEGLFRKTASPGEWGLMDMENDAELAFFRFWTAKEAVLKATGVGIKDLLKCRVQQVLDENHLQIYYDGQDWLIEHVKFDRHLASMVQNRFEIEWIYPNLNLRAAAK